VGKVKKKIKHILKKDRGSHKYFGFTLLELLIVVAIISLLVSMAAVAYKRAKDKGVDAAVKSNLSHAIRQAELYYSYNGDGYAGVCNISSSLPVDSISPQLLSAARASGLSIYVINSMGSNSVVTCNAILSSWAAEAPLKTPGQMWCVDSGGKSVETSGSTLSASNDWNCN
jgi:prepilin-type N-terminal cleavage/methylation domain-containing protein